MSTSLENSKQLLLERFEAIAQAYDPEGGKKVIAEQLFEALIKGDEGREGVNFLVGELRRAYSGYKMTDKWIAEFEAKLSDSGFDLSAERWKVVKTDLQRKAINRIESIKTSGKEALENLTEAWKDKPKNPKKLDSLKKKLTKMGKSLKKAMDAHVLELEAWDLLKAYILVDTAETAETVDSVDSNESEETVERVDSNSNPSKESDETNEGIPEEEAKDEKRELLLKQHTSLFRELVKYVEDDKTAATRQRLDRVDHVMRTCCVHDDTGDDDDDGHLGSADGKNGKFIFAIAAFVCDAAVDAVLADAEGDNPRDGLDGKLGSLWASRLRMLPEENHKAWFGRVLDLVEEGDFHGRENVRSFFDKHREKVDQLRQSDGHDVKSVVGYAKELLDARLLLGHRWTTSDNETRVVKRIIMSGWRLQPTLADWRDEKTGFGMGDGWNYDPFGEFSGEDLLPPVGDDDDDDDGRLSSPTKLEQHLAVDMFEDNRHGVDLCCILDKEGDVSNRAVLGVQCKFRSRFDVVFKEASGSKLRTYTRDLLEVVKEYGVSVVDGVWSSTTVDAPFPFGKTGPSAMISTDREALSSKRFGALNMQSFDVRFGRASQFQRVKQSRSMSVYEPAPEQPREAYTPRSDRQRDAILDMVRGVLKHLKCQGHMPCGFGKTFVSYMIAALLTSGFDEGMIRRCGFTEESEIRDLKRGLKPTPPRLVVFATPMQRLCHQGLADWCEYDVADAVFGHDNMITCTSSAPVGLKHKPPGPEIVDWIEERFKNNGNRPVAVFVCYDSLRHLEKFCEEHEDEVLLVCDEAHVCVGPRQGKYTSVHGLRAKYRMFQTATAKVHWANAGTGDGKHGIGHLDGDRGGGKRKGRFDGATFACMNDATDTGSFGPVAFQQSWQACMEHDPPLLARPVVRMMDASGSGLSETARRAFAQSKVKLTPETIRSVIGLDDNDDCEKAAGQEEEERANRRLVEGLQLKKTHAEQATAVADLQERVAALELELKALKPKKPKKQGKKRKQDEASGAGSSAGPSDTDAYTEKAVKAMKAMKAKKEELKDAKKELKGAHTALNKTTLALRNLAGKKYGMLTTPTSVRLIQFYSGILRSIAECPEAADEPGSHVSHVVSYHRTVARAQYSMAMAHLVAAALIEEYAAKDNDAARLAVARLSELSLGTVHCYQDPVWQDTTIQRFAYARCGILFNVGIMRVGQNLPIVNGVAFADPMLTVDGIIQSVGRGLRLYGPRGKRCHVFLPVYGGPGEDDWADWDEDFDYHEEEALSVVDAWLDSLDDAARAKLEKDDAKLEKAHEIARQVVAYMSDQGLGPQDVRQIGVLCGPSSSGGGGGSSDGVLSARHIPAQVERRGDGRPPTDAESRMMLDALNAGAEEEEDGGASSPSADAEFRGLAEAIFRVATRTFSGVGRVRFGWMSMYRKVKAYVEKYGKVPSKRHPELGGWVDTQRQAMKGTGKGLKMTAERKRLLEGLVNAQGVKVWVWDVDLDERWMSMYRKVKAYVEKYGELPSTRHPELGSWVSRQRRAKKDTGSEGLTAERKRLLEGLVNAQGDKVWAWDVYEEQWMEMYKKLVAYVEKYGEVPSRSHPELGKWVSTQRRAKKDTGSEGLTGERERLLEALPGWTWEGHFPKGDEMKKLIAQAIADGTFPPRLDNIPDDIPGATATPAPIAKRRRTVTSNVSDSDSY